MISALAAGMFVLVGSLTLTGSASAATVGTNPNQAPAFGAGCEVSSISPLLPVPANCSMFDPFTGQTPRGSWRVTSARVRTGPRSGPMQVVMIRALRSQAGTQGVICCFEAASGPVFTPGANRITRVNLNLPAVNTVQVIDGERVEVVDYLGISLLNQSASIGFANTPTPATTFFAPAFTPGSTRLGGAIPPPVVPMVTAELSRCAGTSGSGGAGVSAVCPGGGFTILGRKALSRGGTRVGLTARVPSAGVLSLRQASRGKQLVRKSRSRARKAGKVRVTANLTGRGNRILKRKGRVALKLRLIFNPVNGPKSSKTTRVVFRR